MEEACKIKLKLVGKENPIIKKVEFIAIEDSYIRYYEKEKENLHWVYIPLFQIEYLETF